MEEKERADDASRSDESKGNSRRVNRGAHERACSRKPVRDPTGRISWVDP